MKTITELLPALVKLRHHLHQIPETANKEFKTHEVIRYSIRDLEPDLVIENIGKTGMAVVFNGMQPGKTLMFRAELDALAIEEDIDIPYHSGVKNTSHKCGHDGHMTMLFGLACLIAENRPEKGRVVLLYQPAEETGTGAESVLADPQFSQIIPDYVFAIHNIPGFSKGSVILRQGVFSMTSEGMKVILKGMASHAAYPENGISPLQALTGILNILPGLNDGKTAPENYTQLTVTFVKMGRSGFATSPGQAEIGLVIRAIHQKDLQHLQELIKNTVRKIAVEACLEEQFIHIEQFPVTSNNPEVVKRLSAVLSKNSFEVTEAEMPLKWSEDFGHFTSRFPGALIGLGAGSSHSDLHTRDYDFPDEILEPGVLALYHIYTEFIAD